MPRGNRRYIILRVRGRPTVTTGDSGGLDRKAIDLFPPVIETKVPHTRYFLYRIYNIYVAGYCESTNVFFRIFNLDEKKNEKFQ